MGDWMKMSKEDEALFRSCTELENIVLLDGVWTKMPKQTIGMMMMDSYLRSTEDALKKLGVEYELERGAGDNRLGHRFGLRNGAAFSDIDHDYDIESEHACTTVTLNDGRTAQGFAKLQRLRPH